MSETGDKMDEGRECLYCGKEKDIEQFCERPHGTAAVCMECEQAVYDRIAKESGATLALFVACAAFDVPFFPDALPEPSEFSGMADRWLWYNREVSGRIYGEDRVMGFLDGETNVLRIFARKVGKVDTSTYIASIAAQKVAEDANPGTPEQRQKWGTGSIYPNIPTTGDLYRDLDRRYELYMTRYKGINDPQLVQNVITVCKWDVIMQHLTQHGNLSEAKNVQSMKDMLMSSEQMRKKDEKPVEGMRMDALVVAMEKAGLMEDKKFLSYPDLVRVFWERFFKAKKYDYSVDAADHMIYDIWNTMRMDADQAIDTILPGGLELKDELGEFEPEPTESEKKVEAYAKLTPVMFDRSGDGEGS